MIRKVILPLLVVAISVGAAMTLMATSPTLEPNTPAPIPTSVRVMDVVPHSVTMSVQSQGSVNPNVESQLIPEVSGRIVWMSPAMVTGGHFNSGESLVRLDDRDLRSSLQRARANLTRAQAEHQHTRFEHQRLESLSSRQLASRSQIENALRAYRIAQATLQDATAAHEQAQRDLSRDRDQGAFRGARA